MLPFFYYREIVERSLREDLGSGDFTTRYCVDENSEGTARIAAKEEGLVAGMGVSRDVFLALDKSIECNFMVAEGGFLEPGQVILTVSGKLQPILSAERTALNFLQRLSGIATKTARWKKEIDGYPARLADTRKTTPGWRILEKYAVRLGGGCNHRFALDGGILIKENHIRAAGGIKKAVAALREKAPLTLQVEVEVSNLHELQEALEAGAGIIMLDNMDLDTMQKAVQMNGGRALLEASGKVTFDRLKEIAATGVDLISSGALTHSSRVLDMSLLIE